MNENSVCPIWGTEASIKSNGRDGSFVDSPRAAGRYFISRTAERKLEHNEDERLRARLTSWLIEQRRFGEQCPKITGATIEEMERRRDLAVHERADRLLQYIHNKTPRIGVAVDVVRASATTSATKVMCRVMETCAHSESINWGEVSFLLDYLKSQGWLKDHPGSSENENVILTIEGYARLAELERTDTVSSKTFVAMWFDDSMEGAWENGIRPAIEDAGYEASRIDRKEHANKIDDEIIAEIRRSRFIVADFTHGDDGARAGVYYEAGFAHGLDIPVIFTCQKEVFENIHFDTRQYNHIVWEKPEELREKLANRIAAVIGDGPGKAQDAR